MYLTCLAAEQTAHDVTGIAVRLELQHSLHAGHVQLSRTVRFRQYLHDKEIHNAGNSTRCFASPTIRGKREFYSRRFLLMSRMGRQWIENAAGWYSV
jgi:hypothetical protein